MAVTAAEGNRREPPLAASGSPSTSVRSRPQILRRRLVAGQGVAARVCPCLPRPIPVSRQRSGLIGSVKQGTSLLAAVSEELGPDCGNVQTFVN
jgi:hypothetical protein